MQISYVNFLCRGGILFCLVCLFLFIGACNTTLEEPQSLSSLSLVTKDELRDPLVTKKVQRKIEKDDFINLKTDDLHEIQEYLAGKKASIEENYIVDFRVLVYRFYSQVKVEGGNLVCSAGSGAEIGISEDVFQLYKKELTHLNNDIAKMNEQERPDDNALRKNLEEGLKQLIE